MKAKRTDFISKSTDVRDMFKFAQPNQVLEAVRTYCCSMYGAMTWSLCSSQAMQVYNCWNTCVKLACLVVSQVSGSACWVASGNS